MALYIVRHADIDVQSYGVMIVTANSNPELFWAVDEFIDPFVCKYKKVPSRVNALVYVSPNESDQWELGGYHAGGVELGHGVSEALLDDKGWHEFEEGDFSYNKIL